MIQRDKLLHFAAGSIIGISCGFNPWVGIILVIIAAVGKELRDLVTKKGTAEWQDIVYTVAGGMCPFLASLPS